MNPHDRYGYRYWPSRDEIRTANLQKKQEWLQSINKAKKGRK